LGFCTVVNCMDGRVQLPVITYLMDLLGVDYVDSITEPGPIRMLAEQEDVGAIRSIVHRIRISTEKHGSKVIAVVGHYDCAGNPMPRQVQREQTLKAIEFLSKEFPGIEIMGLWVDEKWQVHRI